MNQKLDVGTILSDSWELFKKDPAALIVGGVIAAIVPFVITMIGYFALLIPMVIGGASDSDTGAALGVVLGFILFFVLIVAAVIVAVPLYAGLFKMVIRRVREGRPAEIGDVLSCFDQLGRLVWAALVLGVIIGLAMIVIIPGVYLAVIWVYVIPLVVDRRMSLGEAMSASKKLVGTQGFWSTFVALLVLGVIAAVASFVPFSQVVVYPWLIAAVLAMYFVAAGEGALLPSAVADKTRWQGDTASPPAAGARGAWQAPTAPPAPGVSSVEAPPASHDGPAAAVPGRQVSVQHDPQHPAVPPLPVPPATPDAPSSPSSLEDEQRPPAQ